MAAAHGHEDTMPASAGVRRVLTAVMVPLVVVTVAAVVMLWPGRQEPLARGAGGATVYDGTVTAVSEQECPPQQQFGVGRCGEVTVRAEEGPDQGREVVAPMPDGPGAPTVRVGDKVVLAVVTNPADPSQQQYGITDHQRGTPLLLLAVLFAAVIVAFGLRRGLASLAGLAACFVLLLTFVLPALLQGRPPLLVAVVGAAAVMFMIMYVVHGISVRTTVAVLGTLGALVLTGVLALIATGATHLTGFVGDDEMTLFTIVPGLDLQGVLLAGIIIGSLGVLDDVTVSQAATIGEIVRANPALSRWQIYRAGIRVGRAHVASVVNTLVFAYAGASLPLLLLIVLSTTGQETLTVLTAQPIAQEVVRSLVATVGLVAAVPLTTALATLVTGTAHGDQLAPALPRPDRGLPGRPPRHRRGDHRVDPGEALAPESPHHAGEWRW